MNKFEDEMDSGLSKAKAEVHQQKHHDSSPAETSSEDSADAGFVLKEKPYDPDAEEEKTSTSDLDIF